MKRPALNHEERRRLIEAPITFRVVAPKTHAGTLIVRELPTEGRRRPSGRVPDESLYPTTEWED